MACNEGQIQSHKIIVSQSSPILKNILKPIPVENPVIFLTGIKYNNLNSLINFMHQGEVTVAEDDLGPNLASKVDFGLLDLASELGIGEPSSGNTHKSDTIL